MKENSSNEQKQCIFPFALVTDPDFVYNDCTKIHDSFGKYWCSTKVSDRQDFGIRMSSAIQITEFVGFEFYFQNKFLE